MAIIVPSGKTAALFLLIWLGVNSRKSPKIVELEPANDDFENIIVDLEYQDFHIEGKSVGLLRKN